MKKIPLVNSKLYALIDDADYEKVSKYKWYIHRRGTKTYAKSPYYSLRMHRLILNAPNGVRVDHVNGHPLDNRKEISAYVLSRKT